MISTVRDSGFHCPGQRRTVISTVRDSGFHCPGQCRTVEITVQDNGFQAIEAAQPQNEAVQPQNEAVQPQNEAVQPHFLVGTVPRFGVKRIFSQNYAFNPKPNKLR